MENTFKNAEEQLAIQYLEICKKYGINTSLLKDILLLRSSGLKNTEISARIGITNRTVNTYVEKLQRLDNTEHSVLLLHTCLSNGGNYILTKLLNQQEK